MPSHVGSAGTSPGARSSRWSWLLQAATFLAGCALGGVAVGVAAGGDDEPASRAATTAAGSRTSGERDGAKGGAADAERSGLYVRVPDSCVRTADDATTLVEHVDRVVAAIADLEPDRLRQTVDEVQEVRDAVSDVAEQCAPKPRNGCRTRPRPPPLPRDEARPPWRRLR